MATHVHKLIDIECTGLPRSTGLSRPTAEATLRVRCTCGAEVETSARECLAWWRRHLEQRMAPTPRSAWGAGGLWR